MGIWPVVRFEFFMLCIVKSFNCMIMYILIDIKQLQWGDKVRPSFIR